MFYLISPNIESVYLFTGVLTYLPANMVSALVVISSMSGSEAGVKRAALLNKFTKGC